MQTFVDGLAHWVMVRDLRDAVRRYVTDHAAMLNYVALSRMTIVSASTCTWRSISSTMRLTAMYRLTGEAGFIDLARQYAQCFVVTSPDQTCPHGEGHCRFR